MTAFALDHRRSREATVVLGAAPRFQFLATAAFMGVALFLGGGTRQGLWSDAVVQLFALALLAISLNALPYFTSRRVVVPLLIGLAAIALPLLQLIPLPPEVWQFLPGRGPIVAAYQAANIPLPWQPISLDPAATWRSGLSLLPPLAVFVATLRLGRRARRTLSLLLLVIGVLSVLVGLTQVMQGEGSALRFFPDSDTDSVGFFVNRNHYAAFLLCLFPFAAAWIIGLLEDRPREQFLWLAAVLLVLIVLILGLAMARSRAGFFLGVAAALSSLLLAGAIGGRVSRGALAATGGAILVGSVIAIQYAFFGLLARFDTDLFGDFRLDIANITTAAARSFQPVGSGFGSFVPVYQMFETPSALLTSYINHAHNDWLEIWLEGGWVAAGLVSLFLVWLAVAGIRVWRMSSRDGAALDRALACGATISILALLLHSFVDYPLRTTALMTLFAFCCALLVDPVAVPSGPKIPSHGRWRKRFDRWQRKRAARGWVGRFSQ